MSFTATLRATGAGGAASTGGEPDHITVTVLDAHGVPYEMSLGDLPPDGAPHRLVLDLASQLGTAGGAPAGPLRLVRFSAALSLPGTEEKHRLTLADARVTDEDGGVRPLDAGTAGPPSPPSWSAAIGFDDPSLVELPDSRSPTTAAPHAGGPALLAVEYTTGSIPLDARAYPQPPTVTLRLNVEAPAPPPLAGVATDTYLRAIGAKVGATVKVELGGVELPVRITSAVRGIPGTGDDLAGGGSDGLSDSAGSTTGTGSDAAAGQQDGKDAGALLLDLRAVDRQLEAQDAQPLTPTEWWLATGPGASARVAGALRARTDVDTLLVREETAAELRADPLGAGPQSALPAAVVAAAVLAAVGFAVSAVGAIRERNPEFAVLRALGAPRRRLARMIAAEQGLLLLISLAVGVVLGALLTRLVTPLIVLTAQAGQPMPRLLVELPVGRLTGLLAVVLVAPLLVVLATAVRRGDPAAALRRQGED